MVTSKVLQAANGDCQGRVQVIARADRTLLVLADGTGGRSGGVQAADLLLNLAGQSADQLHSVEDCAGLLARVDQALTGRPDCGETTGVVAIVDSGRIYGASVGDSAAWFFFSTGGRSELTRGQARKPLLGSGSLGTPRSFNWELEEGTLVVASDGLWNYTSLEAVQSRVRSRGTADLAVRLAELVRLESGDFPDDVAILTCRIDGA